MASNNGIEGLDLGKVDSKKILTLLECPVCYDYITPPIKQCVKGHLVCSSCYQKLSNCPTCRSDLSKERNLCLEQIAPFLKYPCRYYTFGCKESVLLSKKEIHEKNCPFVVVNCPFHAKCPWAGPLKDIENHIKSKHKIKRKNFHSIISFLMFYAEFTWSTYGQLESYGRLRRLIRKFP